MLKRRTSWKMNVVKSLSEIASFNVANYVWCCYIDENKELVQSKIDDHRTPESSGKKLFDLEECLNKIYPHLAIPTQRCILDTAGFIHKELLRSRNNYDVVNRFNCIRWTPFFTIDKVRSSCKTKNFDISSETLCECCFNEYVENCRSSLSPRELNRLRIVFGDFANHVILYWHWYGRQNRSLMSHINKYDIHYENHKSIENIFKLSVFIEYEVAVFHYWAKLSIDQQRPYCYLVVRLLLFESDYLEFVDLNGLLPMHTFKFFWLQLDNQERFDVMEYNFLDFYRYLLYHESGISSISAILTVWNPSVASLEYFKLLRLASDTANLDLFVLLWKRKLATLSFEAIGHLIWTLLLQKDKDLKLSLMIINDYDREQKIEILNELDERIERVHFDFKDRIEGFLTAASLADLRIAGFPRNPRPTSDRRPQRRGPRRFL